MEKRIYGYMRAMFILIFDGALLYYFTNDWRVTCIVLAIMVAYAFFLGEIFATVRVGAIHVDKLDALSRSKLLAGYEILKKQYILTYRRELNLKLYLVPDDSSFNAFSFGRKRIGITSDALSSLDSYSIAALLSHEVGHVIGFDVCIKRLLFANLVGVSLILLATQLIWYLIVMLICFVVVCLFSSCIGIYLTVGIFKGLTRLGKWISGVVISLIQQMIALVDRHREYSADEISCDLGFGLQLIFILKRYVGETVPARCLSDILYASHPTTAKRIARIDKKQQKINNNAII